MSDLGAGREQPGVIPLRPLAIPEILQGALATMRRQPALLLGVAFVVVGITELISLAVTWNLVADIEPLTSGRTTLTPNERLELLGTLASRLGVSLAIGLIAQAFLSGLVTVVVGKAVLGRRLAPRQAWREVRPRLLPLLGLTVLYTLMVLVGPVIAALLTIVSGGGGALVFFVAGAAVALWLYVRFSIATPALVLEPASIGAALRRSALLVKGAWGRTFGILLLALVAAFTLSLLIQLPFNSLTAPAPDETAGLGAALFATFGATIAGMISYPFTAGVTALIYIDRRMRNENMQVALSRAARDDTT